MSCSCGLNDSARACFVQSDSGQVIAMQSAKVDEACLSRPILASDGSISVLTGAGGYGEWKSWVIVFNSKFSVLE